jgi:hypothetical protein
VPCLDKLFRTLFTALRSFLVNFRVLGGHQGNGPVSPVRECPFLYPLAFEPRGDGERANLNEFVDPGGERELMITVLALKKTASAAFPRIVWLRQVPLSRDQREGGIMSRDHFARAQRDEHFDETVRPPPLGKDGSARSARRN